LPPPESPPESPEELSKRPSDLKVRPLKNGNFCSSSRRAKISTTGIYIIFRGLKFEPDAGTSVKLQR